MNSPLFHPIPSYFIQSHSFYSGAFNFVRTRFAYFIPTNAIPARVGGGLAMICTWVSLRYIWVISIFSLSLPSLILPWTFERDLELFTHKVFLLDLPYPMPLIGLFNFVAGFAAEVSLFISSFDHMPFWLHNPHHYHFSSLTSYFKSCLHLHQQGCFN